MINCILSNNSKITRLPGKNMCCSICVLLSVHEARITFV